MIQYPHPLYDMGTIFLSSAIEQMKTLLAQAASQPERSEKQSERLRLFTILTERYQMAVEPLGRWVDAANLIHQGKANVDEAAYEEVRRIIGPDMECSQEYSTGYMMSELATAIQELHAKPASAGRSTGLAIMTQAYQTFYAIHSYFHAQYPRVQKSEF